MRKGFALLSAIFLMLLIGILMALSFSLSSQTTKQTGQLYLQEQGQLLAKSATEFALLAISGHENNVSCINQINLRYPQGAPMYDINMTLFYIGKYLPAGCNTLTNSIATAESNGTVMIDTFVSYIDPETNETIRFHRRTLQKP